MYALNRQPFASHSLRAVAAPRSRGICVNCRAQQRPALNAAVASSAMLAIAPAVQAAEIFSSASADASSLTLAVGGGAAIAGLGALLIATDPQKRRSEQMQETGGNESEAVKKYFNTAGFERWRKIYGETDDVNKVQLDIRKGHAQTVDKVLKWLDEEGGVQGTTVADAGCGTGSLAIPLALRGAVVSASDISSAMVQEAQARFESAAKATGNTSCTTPKFESLDLESVSGRYHTVTCLDVMIHYPQYLLDDPPLSTCCLAGLRGELDAMVRHLASLADTRLIVSFAPYTPYYAVLKRIGELFPGPSKATRAYLHAEEDVERALQAAGFKVVKREMTATSFYFSRLLEAVRV